MVELSFHKVHVPRPTVEGTHITLHHSDNQIQHVNNKAFTIEAHPAQVTGFMALFHMCPIMMSHITPP